MTQERCQLYTFADLCISRQMYNAVQASAKGKTCAAQSYISLYADMATETEGGQNGNGSGMKLLQHDCVSRWKKPGTAHDRPENVADIEAMIEKKN